MPGVLTATEVVLLTTVVATVASVGSTWATLAVQGARDRRKENVDRANDRRDTARQTLLELAALVVTAEGHLRVWQICAAADLAHTPPTAGVVRQRRVDANQNQLYNELLPLTDTVSQRLAVYGSPALQHHAALVHSHLTAAFRAWLEDDTVEGEAVDLTVKAAEGLRQAIRKEANLAD